MRGIRAALFAARLDGARTLRHEACVDAWIRNERRNAFMQAGAVDGVRILVTHDHESLAAESAPASGIIADVPGGTRRDVVIPETNFVVVALAVAVLRTEACRPAPSFPELPSRWQGAHCP